MVEERKESGWSNREWSTVRVSTALANAILVAVDGMGRRINAARLGRDLNAMAFVACLALIAVGPAGAHGVAAWGMLCAVGSHAAAWLLDSEFDVAARLAGVLRCVMLAGSVLAHAGWVVGLVL